MKKKYVTPVAIEEAFEANSYIAACSYKTSGTANRMRCVNPKHTDHNGKLYFSGVWIEGLEACTTIVNANSTKTEGVWSNPNQGAIVYKLGTETAVLTEEYGNYYIPADIFNGTADYCYGAYQKDGKAITEKVLS